MDSNDNELLAELGRRGMLTGENKALYDELSRRGMIKSEGFFTRTAKKAYNAITGEGKKEQGIKEFTTTFDRPNPMKTAAGMIFSSDEQQMEDVIKNNIPGAEFKNDKFGNKLVRPPGEDWQYINKPGLSSRDVSNAIGQGAAYIGAARVAGAIAPKSLPLRSLLTAGSTAATSAGLDAAAGKMGSEQGVNLPRAGMVGAVGGAGELLAPVFSALWRSARGSMPSVQMAKKTLMDAGYDVSKMTKETLAEFIKTAKKAANVDEAVRLAEAKGLPVPVPLTRGKVTMTAKDQMFEDLASKGAYGDAAESIMKGANQRTDTALRQNVPAIRQAINPEGARIERGQAGEMAQRAIENKYESVRNAVSKAYDAARQHPGTKQILPGNETVQLAESVQKSFADYLPSADKAKSLWDDLLEKTTDPKGASIKDLYDWRRKITTQRTGADRTNASAMTQMINKFDSVMDDYVLNGLMSGDEAAIREWKQAIRLRKLQGKVFEQRNMIGDLIKKTPEGSELKVSPDAASNYIFGVSDTKLLSRPEIARDLNKIRSLLGKDSPEWNAIREEAFLRLAQRGEKGAMTGGDYGFSGVNFKKAVDKSASSNPEVWNLLFSQKEQGLISQFANVAARATNPVRGGANFSNTAVGLSRMAQSLTDALFLGERGKAILSRIFPMAYEGVQMGNAAQAATGRLTMKSIPQGITGGAFATVESQTGQQQ